MHLLLFYNVSDRKISISVYMYIYIMCTYYYFILCISINHGSSDELQDFMYGCIFSNFHLQPHLPHPPPFAHLTYWHLWGQTHLIHYQPLPHQPPPPTPLNFHALANLPPPQPHPPPPPTSSTKSTSTICLTHLHPLTHLHLYLDLLYPHLNIHSFHPPSKNLSDSHPRPLPTLHLPPFLITSTPHFTSSPTSTPTSTNNPYIIHLHRTSTTSTSTSIPSDLLIRPTPHPRTSSLTKSRNF